MGGGDLSVKTSSLHALNLRRLTCPRCTCWHRAPTQTTRIHQTAALQAKGPGKSWLGDHLTGTASVTLDPNPNKHECCVFMVEGIGLNAAPFLQEDPQRPLGRGDERGKYGSDECLHALHANLPDQHWTVQYAPLPTPLFTKHGLCGYPHGHAMCGKDSLVSNVAFLNTFLILLLCLSVLVTIAANGTIQLANPGSDGLQGLQALAMTQAASGQQGTTILQYAQTSDGQQILVPSNQVVVQGVQAIFYFKKSKRFNFNSGVFCSKLPFRMQSKKGRIFSCCLKVAYMNREKKTLH